MALYFIVYRCISTTDAEYMAMMEAMKEAIWFQGLLDDLEIDQDLLKINCDSMNAIYLAKNQMNHVRTKHIDACSTLFGRFLMKVILSY